MVCTLMVIDLEAVVSFISEKPSLAVVKSRIECRSREKAGISHGLHGAEYKETGKLSQGKEQYVSYAFARMPRVEAQGASLW